MNNIEMRRSDCALTNTLTHNKEIIPIERRNQMDCLIILWCLYLQPGASRAEGQTGFLMELTLV